MISVKILFKSSISFLSRYMSNQLFYLKATFQIYLTFYFFHMPFKSIICSLLINLSSLSSVFYKCFIQIYYLDRVKRIWYLSPMRAAKVQASLRIRAVSPEPSLLAHTSSESRGTFRQKARSLAPLNGWACAVKICHGGMLEDTNSLDGAHLFSFKILLELIIYTASPFKTLFIRVLCNF